MALSTTLEQFFCRRLNPVRNTKHIIFSDQSAPEGAKIYDVSESQDGGVVAWNDGEVCYISTQRTGVKVTAPEDCSNLFQFLSDIESIDTSMLEVAPCDTTQMFQNCYKLQTIIGMEKWDVSEVTAMTKMFDHCCALNNIDGVVVWDTTNVTDTRSMFCCCDQIVNFNALAKWNVGWVSDMTGMFEMCNMKNVGFVKDWDTSAVERMGDMFGSCIYLENLNGLENWNISNAKDIGGMFSQCYRLTDASALNNWSLPKTTMTNFMFSKCGQLKVPPVWYKEKGYSL